MIALSPRAVRPANKQGSRVGDNQSAFATRAFYREEIDDRQRYHFIGRTRAIPNRRMAQRSRTLRATIPLFVDRVVRECGAQIKTLSSTTRYRITQGLIVKVEVLWGTTAVRVAM